jgi:hypothetical protein
MISAAALFLRMPGRNRPNRLQIISLMLADGEGLIVPRRLRQILNDARRRPVRA